MPDEACAMQIALIRFFFAAAQRLLRQPWRLRSSLRPPPFIAADERKQVSLVFSVRVAAVAAALAAVHRAMTSASARTPLQRQWHMCNACWPAVAGLHSRQMRCSRTCACLCVVSSVGSPRPVRARLIEAPAVPVLRWTAARQAGAQRQALVAALPQSRQALHGASSRAAAGRS